MISYKTTILSHLRKLFFTSKQNYIHVKNDFCNFLLKTRIQSKVTYFLFHDIESSKILLGKSFVFSFVLVPNARKN